MTTLIRLIGALPLALVLMLWGESIAASGEVCGVADRSLGLFNPCAQLDTSRIDDLRPSSLEDSGVRLVE